MLKPPAQFSRGWQAMSGTPVRACAKRPNGWSRSPICKTGAVPYLHAFARVLGGHLHLKAAVADRGGAREKLARFYIQRMLPEYTALLAHAQAGAEDLYALTAEELAG